MTPLSIPLRPPEGRRCQKAEGYFHPHEREPDRVDDLVQPQDVRLKAHHVCVEDDDWASEEDGEEGWGDGFELVALRGCTQK